MTDKKWVYNGVEFKPGDRVKIVRFEVDGAPDGMGNNSGNGEPNVKWENSWIHRDGHSAGMDGAFGGVFEISSIDETGVIFTEFVEDGYDALGPAVYAYPLSVLEHVK